ncbi:hypothetical protein LPJ81_003817 [Coemansia sp. IMI 209127]|nr:hypothetical protein LPJ81_003817 [Coemansia sp. IMI 209127]
MPYGVMHPLPPNGAFYPGFGQPPQQGVGLQPSGYITGAPAAQLGPRIPYGKKYGKSSVFVPAEWHLDSSKAGFANMLGRIFASIDHQYNSMNHLPIHAHPGAMPGIGSVLNHPGVPGIPMSHHSIRPATAHAVSVVSDPHGMFSLGNTARMGMSRGHARVSTDSTPTICPRCKKRIMTLVKRHPDGVNITATAAAIIFGLIFQMPKALLPLTLMPLQMTSLQPSIHYCPMCNYKLGKNVRVYIPVEDIHDQR